MRRTRPSGALRCPPVLKVRGCEGSGVGVGDQALRCAQVRSGALRCAEVRSASIAPSCSVSLRLARSRLMMDDGHTALRAALVDIMMRTAWEALSVAQYTHNTQHTTRADRVHYVHHVTVPTLRFARWLFSDSRSRCLRACLLACLWVVALGSQTFHTPPPRHHNAPCHARRTM